MGGKDKIRIILLDTACMATIVLLNTMRSIVPNIIVYLLIAVVFIYIVFLNYIYIMKEDTSSEEKKVFSSQLKSIEQIKKSLNSRRDVIEKLDKSSKIYEAFNLIEDKIKYNIDYAMNLIHTYDYVYKPNHDKIDSLVSESVMLIKKYNDLLEQIVALEYSSQDVDIIEVDDIIQSLRRVNNNE